MLEGDPIQGGGRIDLSTGEVLTPAAIEYAAEVGEIDEDDEPERWLWVHCEGSHEGYRDMEWFIDDLHDPQLAGPRDLRMGRLPPVQGHGVRTPRPELSPETGCRNPAASSLVAVSTVRQAPAGGHPRTARVPQAAA